MRLLGILCGSALAITTLFMVLGLPQLPPDTRPEALAAIESLPVNPASEVSEKAPPVDASRVAEEPELLPATQAQAVEAPEDVSIPAPGPSASEEHWYAFWSPFRSELAARGFVSILQRNTGMDYRVVQIEPGVYEVAFAYENDADIPACLATISAATGLELPGG